jgi:hypothetical protein
LGWRRPPALARISTTHLGSRGYQLCLLHPRQTHQFAQQRGLWAKTDKLDATTIARVLLSGEARAGYVPTELIATYRELVRLHTQLADEVARYKNEIQALLAVLFPEFSHVFIYIRFRRWRFYAEAGLAKKTVTVHLYTGTLKVEYQDTDLAFYTVTWHEDNKHITEVSNPRVIETSYRSPRLTLWTLGPDEWLLFKKLPEYAARTKRKRVDVIQLAFPDIGENQQQAVSSPT